MDLKEQIILEYLEQGCGYRKLQSKYGISRTTICKWVQIYQGVHALARSDKQQKHYIRDMKDPDKKRALKKAPTQDDLLKKIAALEKQLRLGSWHTKQVLINPKTRKILSAVREYIFNLHVLLFKPGML